MRILILTALLALSSMASAEQPQQLIDVQHDARRQVTCWITPSGGISCLPDSSLPQNATPERQKNRASQTSLPSENTALDAGSLPHDERFQL